MASYIPNQTPTNTHTQTTHRQTHTFTGMTVKRRLVSTSSNFPNRKMPLCFGSIVVGVVVVHNGKLGIFVCRFSVLLLCLTHCGFCAKCDSLYCSAHSYISSASMVIASEKYSSVRCGAAAAAATVAPTTHSPAMLDMYMPRKFYFR